MENSLQLFIAEKQLIGKKIKWSAPAYKYNNDYQGVAIIKDVNRNEHQPLICETISGDNLSFAFIDQYDNDDVDNEILSYSDGGRTVTYDVVCDNVDDLIEKHWNNESFLAYYDEDKRIFHNTELSNLLILEGIENPFKTIEEFRKYAFDYKCDKCKKYFENA